MECDWFGYDVDWCKRTEGERIVRNLLIGFVLGLVVATVGFSGVARILDTGVTKVQEAAKEAAK
jgi:capsular polysaccharide biosynthesis protein